MKLERQIVEEVLAAVNTKNEAADSKTQNPKCKPSFKAAINTLGIKLTEPNRMTAKTIETLSEKMKKIAGKASRIASSDENLNAYITLSEIAAMASAISELTETVRSIRGNEEKAKQLGINPAEIMNALKQKELEFSKMLESNCLTQRLSKDIFLQLESKLISDVAEMLLEEKEGAKLITYKDPYGVIKETLRRVIILIKAGKIDASWKAAVNTTAAIVAKVVGIKMKSEEKSPELK